LRRVLIVEDDPGTGSMLEMLCVAEGYEAELVTDGVQALKRLEGPPVDLVILDVMIPVVDGIEVLRQLRMNEDPEWRATPVIVSTARGSDDAVWDGWKAGADYYLVKPFDLDDFREVARRLMDEADATTPVPEQH
jgi:DNA-binding response OmpR family regulator